MGGLGNQLFQWAFAKSLSIIYDIPYYIDRSFYLNQAKVTPREYSLHKFELKVNLKDKNTITDLDFITIDDSVSTIQIDTRNNYFLSGYFQSEQYFLPIATTIKNDLTINNATKNKLIEKYGNLSNSVAIHARRTDYLTSGNGFHPVQPISYYQKALKLLEHYDKLLIFSDDIDWCKLNFSFNSMIFIENNSDVEDLWLMSMCRDNIIANSSFSWWAAWLNNNENKRIIAPQKWFKHKTPSILIPKSWIIL